MRQGCFTLLLFSVVLKVLVEAMAPKIDIIKEIQIGKEEIKVTLKWDKVAKRISELIATNRYLRKQELEHYPVFLQKQVQRKHEHERQIKIEEQGKDTEPTSVETIQKVVPKEWSVGDTVYIGITEYVIMDIASDSVTVSEKEFPNKVTRQAEMRFLRGHFYFLLKILFKNIPPV